MEKHDCWHFGCLAGMPFLLIETENVRKERELDEPHGLAAVGKLNPDFVSLFANPTQPRKPLTFVVAGAAKCGRTSRGL
jgi:hypothetical protein